MRHPSFSGGSVYGPPAFLLQLGVSFNADFRFNYFEESHIALNAFSFWFLDSAGPKHTRKCGSLAVETRGQGGCFPLRFRGKWRVTLGPLEGLKVERCNVGKQKSLARRPFPA